MRGLARRKVVAIAACLVVLAAFASIGYLAWSNYDRAERWQARAEKLDKNAAALNELLIERSARLNARTGELNEMAAKVRRANRALRRSERDVASLAHRQRELANEKAQIEDERAALRAEGTALGEVASAFIACKDGLLEIIGYIADDDYYSVSYSWPEVSSDCQLAEGELAEYSAVYGG